MAFTEVEAKNKPSTFRTREIHFSPDFRQSVEHGLNYYFCLLPGPEVLQEISR